MKTIPSPSRPLPGTRFVTWTAGHHVEIHADLSEHSYTLCRSARRKLRRHCAPHWRWARIGRFWWRSTRPSSRFDQSVILLSVRWSLAYAPSLRDLEGMKFCCNRTSPTGFRPSPRRTENATLFASERCAYPPCQAAGKAEPDLAPSNVARFFAKRAGHDGSYSARTMGAFHFYRSRGRTSFASSVRDLFNASNGRNPKNAASALR